MSHHKSSTTGSSSRTKTISPASALLTGLLVAALYVLNSCVGETPSIPTDSPIPSGTPGRVLPGTPGRLPSMPSKPQAVQLSSFKGCPPEGDGGDAVLNHNKNRVDEGEYVPVQIDALLELAWPPAIERKDHSRWSAADTAAVARYEGIPLAVEGYLAGAKLEGPESPNCHGADAEFKDYHIWLTKTAGEGRKGSVVVESTPRVRARHPRWTNAALDQLVKNQQRVRISGWLMLDPEHPDQIGQTRGTIWEIHPIIQIEVQQSGRWVTLDELTK